MKRVLKLLSVAGSLLFIIFLSSCGDVTAKSSIIETSATTVFVTTPAPIATATSSSNPLPAGFTQFKGDAFTLAYPTNWQHEQSNNYYTFTRSDRVTQFIVGLHNNDKNPCVFLQHVGMGLSCTQGDVAGVTHAASITVNGITWQQNDWRAYLANTDYVMRQLTYVNPQSHDTTTIVYADYAQVGSSSMIAFSQATSKYFQPMLQSFRFQ